MLFSDVFYLIEQKYGKNDNGDNITVEDERVVFGNKLSVRQSEFYQAQSTRLRPEIVLEMHVSEYQDESKLRFKEQLYDIIRTFEKGERIELVCEREGV